MNTYERWPSASDSRLVDSITALEAVLGTPVETSYRLSSRVASLLAENDDEQAGLFESLREFYDTRSRVVHGTPLKKKHKERLNSVDELRAIVRTLLRGLIHLTVQGHERLTRAFFERQLDAELIRTEVREELRRAMGFTGGA
jgi:ABC-type phosphate transport system auxiliary subunit